MPLVLPSPSQPSITRAALVAAHACGATPQRFKLLNSPTIEENVIGIGSQPMQSRCMIDDDVISGAGNGAKFILVHGGGSCTLVSKCFPAYRSDPTRFKRRAAQSHCSYHSDIFAWVCEHFALEQRCSGADAQPKPTCRGGGLIKFDPRLPGIRGGYAWCQAAWLEL